MCRYARCARRIPASPRSGERGYNIPTLWRAWLQHPHAPASVATTSPRSGERGYNHPRSGERGYNRPRSGERGYNRAPNKEAECATRRSFPALQPPVYPKFSPADFGHAGTFFHFRAQRNASLSAARLIKYLHLAYLAKPAADRVVYRAVRNTRAGHLVGLGLGCGRLTRNLIQLAAQYTARERVRFTGIDLFEMRPAASPGLSLKQAHSLLTPSGARVRLVPGDPFSALARTANSLLDTDLVVIRADQDPASLQRAWFYLPRMLHEHSVVLVEQPGREGQDGTYRMLDLDAVRQLADAQTSRRRAA
jgi:hypothetical protein